MFYAIIFLLFADGSVELHMLDRGFTDPAVCVEHLSDLLTAVEDYAKFGYAECKHLPSKSL